MPRVVTGYKKFCTTAEIKLLMQFVSQIKNDSIKLAFLFLIFTGLRVSEVCSLQFSQISGNNLTLKLAKSGRQHNRIIPDFLVQQLNEYKAKYNLKDGWLFPTSLFKFYGGGYEHLQRDTLIAYMSKFRKEYKLNDIYYTCQDSKRKNLYRISLHTIRHYYLSQVYEQTKDILVVASIIGHKKVQTTYDYITAYNKFKEEQKVSNMIVNVVMH